MRSWTVSGSVANFRMVSAEPSTASGGTTALTRLPSGRRASTIGLDSSTRRPIRETILSIVRRRCASSVKCASAGISRPAFSSQSWLCAVDHDLGDVRVAQERLDRPVAEDVVADLLGDPGPVAAAQRPVLRAEHVGEDLADLGVELVLVHVRVVETRTHLLEQLDVDAALELLDPVVLRRALANAAAQRGSGGRRVGSDGAAPPVAPSAPRDGADGGGPRRPGACRRRATASAAATADVDGRDRLGDRVVDLGQPLAGLADVLAAELARRLRALAGGGQTVGKAHGLLTPPRAAALGLRPRSAGCWASARAQGADHLAGQGGGQLRGWRR